MHSVCHVLLGWWHLGEEMRYVERKMTKIAPRAFSRQEIILAGNVDLVGDMIVDGISASCVLRNEFQKEVYRNVANAVDYRPHQIGNSDALTNVFALRIFTSINLENVPSVLLVNSHHIRMMKENRLAYDVVLIHSVQNVVCCVKNVLLEQFKIVISAVARGVQTEHSQIPNHFLHQVRVVYLDKMAVQYIQEEL